VSIDTLDPGRFAELTGAASLDTVVDGIQAARQVGLGVKLNIVAMKGINDREYPEFLSFALKHGCDMRFIELMPQMYNEKVAQDRYISSDRIMLLLQRKQKLTSLDKQGSSAKERLFHPVGHDIRIGFISPVSDPFCSSCNRLRLMPEGTLKTCLYGKDGVNIKDLVRSGAKDSRLREVITELVKQKPEKHQMGCDDSNLVMFRTGG
jgi:cyclic pyranopterin phosphate synthase